MFQYVSFISCYNFTKRDIKHLLMCWSCFDGSIQTSVFFTKCMIIGTLLCRLIFLLLRFLFLFCKYNGNNKSEYIE